MVIHHSHGIPVGHGTHHNLKQEMSNVKHSVIKKEDDSGLEEKGSLSRKGYSLEHMNILKY